MRADHTLALYRAVAAMLFVAWFACIGAIGQRYAPSGVAPQADGATRLVEKPQRQLALNHPPGESP